MNNTINSIMGFFMFYIGDVLCVNYRLERKLEIFEKEREERQQRLQKRQQKKQREQEEYQRKQRVRFFSTP